MRPPSALVLRPKHAMEGVGQVFTNGVEVLRNNAECDAAAQVHEARDRRARRIGGGRKRKPVPRLVFQRRRQGMEHRQMRRYFIAIGGIVAAAQGIEPGNIGWRQFGGDYQRGDRLKFPPGCRVR